MDRDRINSWGLPSCPGSFCEVESDDDSDPLFLEWPLGWNMAKIPSMLQYISASSTNLFVLSKVDIQVVESEEGRKVFVEVQRERRALVMVGATHGLKGKPMVGRRVRCEVHIYVLAKKEKNSSYLDSE